MSDLLKRITIDPDRLHGRLAFADCALLLQIFSLCYRRANRARRSFKSIHISKMRISMPSWPLLPVRQTIHYCGGIGFALSYRRSASALAGSSFA